MTSPDCRPGDRVKQPGDLEAFQAVLLCPGSHADDAVLDQLRNDRRVDVRDSRDDQLRSLRELHPVPDAALLDEPTQWAYYPWRRTIVGVLGPRGYRAVRLADYRNLITTREQGHLCELRIGVAGLAVGHAITHTLALQGLCGELRLADFDQRETSDHNGVPASIFDVAVDPAIVAARRIAELDPYVRLSVIPGSATSRTVNALLDDLDLVVEQCDSPNVKAMIREAARQRRLPVLTSYSDSGLIDVAHFRRRFSSPQAKCR